MDRILDLFHHIHHKRGRHKVHHCGDTHIRINPKLDYFIKHCSCGKHSINKRTVIGHTINENLELVEIKIKFKEKCPKGGWHIESGVRAKN